MSAAPARSYWQRFKDSVADVWNYDYVDANGHATRPLDDGFTMRVRNTVHDIIRPAGRGVGGAVMFVGRDTPLFLYDNTIGVPIHGLKETGDANWRRLATVGATLDVINHWGDLQDFQARRNLNELLAGQATFAGMGLGVRALRLQLPAANVAQSNAFRKQLPGTVVHPSGDVLLYSGVQQGRATALMEKAASAIGHDLSRYVDDVVVVSRNVKGNEITPGSTILMVGAWLPCRRRRYGGARPDS